LEDDKLIIEIVQEEQHQGHSTRKNLYKELENVLGLPIISLFTSFAYPVMLEDNDADMIEGLLQKCDLSRGFYLLLSSPGGDGLAAERIINACRTYSGTGEYKVIVPSKAKSAATMISLGASEIIMSPTSELGPIDPQMVLEVDGQPKWYSLFNIVKSYNELFSAAIKEDGNLQPFIQQLDHYDARDIEEYKSMIDLSRDIAIKSLKNGMLSKLSAKKIEQKINILLTPEEKKVHGRPIYSQDAINCGLKITQEDVRGINWSKIYELYVRINNFVSTNRMCKCIESKDYSFVAKIGGKS
jgi:hypothetical protein